METGEVDETDADETTSEAAVSAASDLSEEEDRVALTTAREERGQFP
jgi:hypothetical protein